MSTFKEFKQTVMIAGQEVEALITVKIDEDYDTEPEGDFDFGDAEENAKYLARFKSGDLFMANISVEAYALGETGSDCLGACHLNSNNCYDSNKYERDVDDIVNSHGMVQHAIDELITVIVLRANALKRFADGAK